MPKNFASSLLLRRNALSRTPGRALGAACLIAVTLLATGCGGGGEKTYGTPEVEAAFETAGISLRESLQGFFVSPRATSDRDEAAEPLTALVDGVRDAFLVPSLNQPDRTLTSLRDRYRFVRVWVYPDAADAEAKAAEYSDLLEAADLLGDRREFGYYRRGNVLVRYSVFNSSSRVPGSYGRWDSVRTLGARMTKQITAALDQLG